MDDLPDVPWLVEVNTLPPRRNRLAIIATVVGTPLLWPVSLYVVYVICHHQLYLAGPARDMIIRLAIAAPLFGLAVAAAFCRFWRTDAQGLTQINILGWQRKAAWDQVTDVSTTKPRFVNGRPVQRHITYHRLRTTKGRITVLGNMPKLTASLVQHLKPLGKAGGIKICPTIISTAMSLWMRIPDSIPVELDWEATGGRRPRGVKRIELRSDHITIVKGRKAMTIPWSSITSAVFLWSAAWLVTNGRSIAIPYVDGDGSSARMILSLVQHLRTAERPVALAIPEWLFRTAGIEPELIR